MRGVCVLVWLLLSNIMPNTVWELESGIAGETAQ